MSTAEYTLSYRIRAAHAVDLDALFALMKMYHDYDHHNFDRKKARNDLRRLQDRRPGTVLLALDGRIPAG